MRLNEYNVKVMIGIFSYNEGESPRAMYDEIKKQCLSSHLSCSIVLLDESDDPRSKRVIEGIKREGVRNLISGKSRKGKVHGYNQLFKEFLSSGNDVLMHFDSDLSLSHEAVFLMTKSILGGYDIVSGISKPLSQNLLQRVLSVMQLPHIWMRESGNFNYPGVGHSGGYSRRAVKNINVIPETGINEEIFVLISAFKYRLKIGVVKGAECFYRPPGTLEDYISSNKRVVGRIKSLEPSVSTHEPDQILLLNYTIKNIYSRPLDDSYFESVFKR